MASKIVLSALTIYSAATAAAATSSTSEGFSIKQVAVQGTNRIPVQDYANTLRKYGADVPLHVSDAAAESGSATTNSANGGQMFLTPVTVGQDTLHLDIDTGSSDLWVFSSETPASERGSHSYYTPGSDVQKLNGASWSVSYGDGSTAGGDVYLDTVTIGGVSYAQQAVESAEQVSSTFTANPADGIMGLAFSGANMVHPQQQKTFFENVASSLDQPLFAADLKQNGPGVYDFGYIDKSKYTGNIVYTPVDSSKNYWTITTGSYAINGQDKGQALTGIVDTGTSLLLIEDDILSEYYGAVNGAQESTTEGGWVYPCSETLPSFSLVIGGYQATIPSSYLNYGTINSTTCYGGVQSSAGIGFDVFGDIWIKSQYVVFDKNGPQIGVASQA